MLSLVCCNSLKQLFTDDECVTLEEIVKTSPTRSNNNQEGVMTLQTLKHLKHATKDKSNSVSVLSRLKRVPRPLVDLAYYNSIDESPDAIEMLRDIFVTVLVYRPLFCDHVDVSTQVGSTPPPS